MKKTFAISDTHFNHANIIKYCNRPFADVQEMNKALIRNWNSKVGLEDEIWHFGDVGLFGSASQAKEIVSQLNGIKKLILGNHDKKKWDWFNIGFSEVHEGIVRIENPTKDILISALYLSHCPMETREFPNDFIINLHGHLHNKPYEVWDGKRRLDYSVENIGYIPKILIE